MPKPVPPPKPAPLLVQAPAKDLTPDTAVFFGVISTPEGWVPVCYQVPSGRTAFLQDPMPYMALAYEYLVSAVQAHYAGLTQ
jgi:hypothetical protein